MGEYGAQGVCSPVLCSVMTHFYMSQPDALNLNHLLYRLQARISNNKLLRAKREQAALQAKLASEPRRLMSGKAKKALLKARRQAQREAAGGEESNNPDPCKSSDGEITADGQPHSPAAWV